MPNDTIIADMKMQDPDEINKADPSMVEDSIHKILSCEVLFIFIERLGMALKFLNVPDFQLAVFLIL